MRQVIIVSKTRIGDGFCIGGIDMDSGESYRLTHKTRQADSYRSWPAYLCVFNIGQVWEGHINPSASHEPPHNEDQIFSEYTLLREASVVDTIRTLSITTYRGHLSKTYEGGLIIGSNGNAYLPAISNLPNYSTCFWIADWSLEKQEHLNNDKIQIRYKYDEIYNIKYVGDSLAVDHIPAGSLLRLSLARKFRPTGSTDDRYYLQISGWFF
jgi:hypothetical protein